VDQASKMAYLGYRAYPWTVRPTAALVAEYERRFGLRLPPAYRRFLLRFGGYGGDARCPLQEPAPYEDPVDVGPFMGFWPAGCERSDIRGHTEGLRRFAPPEFVPVMLAWGNSCVVAIKCSGSDVGHVYLFDEAGQAELKKMPVRPVEVPTHLRHRYTTMERYFKLRRAERLPPKPDNEIIVAPSGLQTVLFRLATTFDEFLAALQRYGELGGGCPSPATLGRVRGPRPLNRLYRLLPEAGDRPYAVDFGRQRCVISFTCGQNWAGASEEEDGRGQVCYQTSELIDDVHSELCTPEEAVSLIEVIMSRKWLHHVPRPAAAAEPAPVPDRGGVTASRVPRRAGRRGR
jgi:hypothetical protein